MSYIASNGMTTGNIHSDQLHRRLLKARTRRAWFSQFYRLKDVQQDCVEEAKARSKDIVHQMKFMSPMKRFATGLALAS